MKGYNKWSYRPYRPFLTEIGDIYICRIAPRENSVHMEWLDAGEASYDIYLKERDAEAFFRIGATASTEYDIENLKTDTDYEFFVQASGEGKA